MDNDLLFKPTGFFLLRCPLLPVDNLFPYKFTEGDYSKQLQSFSSSLVQEAILVASHSLYSSLDSWINGNSKDQTKKKGLIESKVNRYVLRMVSRPTPFGLFSGVTYGRISNHTNLKIYPLYFNRKRSRPDMEWLYTIINHLEHQSEILLELSVIRNSALILRKDRLDLPYISNCGQDRKNRGKRKKSASLKRSTVIDAVFNITGQKIMFRDLVMHLSTLFPTLSVGAIIQFLSELVIREYLISELRPPLSNSDPLQYVITLLDGISIANDIRGKLIEIAKSINEYDNLPIGCGIQKHLEIITKMKNLAESSTPLMTDMSISSERLSLSNNIANEAAKAAQLLWLLSSERNKNKKSILEDYHSRFREKYGTYVEIPVLDVLNTDTGLGPLTMNKDLGESLSALNNLDNLLLNKLWKAISKMDEEIEITDSEFLLMRNMGNCDTYSPPNSLELCIEVLTKHDPITEDENFQLVVIPSHGPGGAGQTFGRFVDILGSEFKDILKEFYLEQSLLTPYVKAVEFSFLPSDGRIANVAISPVLRDFEFVLGTNTSGKTTELNLRDIVVGATPSRLYLKSVSLNNELFLTHQNMISSKHWPPVLSFMHEISNNVSHPLYPFSWGGLENAPYLPRVRYRKTILKPRSWHVSLNDLHQFSDEDHTTDIELFTTWCKHWDVPRYVYLIQDDTRLLFDIQISFHVNELVRELQKQKVFCLQEKVGTFEESCVFSVNGKYLSEIIIPFVRNGPPQSNDKIVCRSKPPSPRTDKSFFLPGSEWAFVKIYCEREQQDNIISNEMLPFIDQTICDGLVKRWFYIRYMDDYPHLRLRIQGNSTDVTCEIISRIHRWSKEMHERGLITNVCLDSYERELVRYGGIGSINYAEDVFYTDSVLCSLVISQYNSIDVPIVVIAALGILNLLQGLGESSEFEANWLMKNVTNAEEFRSEFRQWRPKMIELINSSFLSSFNLTIYKRSIVENAVRLRKETLQNYWRTLTEDQKMEPIELENIVTNLVHLHCNRLMEINSFMERKALAFAQFGLNSFLKWKQSIS